MIAPRRRANRRRTLSTCHGVKVSGRRCLHVMGVRASRCLGAEACTSWLHGCPGVWTQDVTVGVWADWKSVDCVLGVRLGRRPEVGASVENFLFCTYHDRGEMFEHRIRRPVCFHGIGKSQVCTTFGSLPHEGLLDILLWTPLPTDMQTVTFGTPLLDLPMDTDGHANGHFWTPPLDLL